MTFKVWFFVVLGALNFAVLLAVLARHQAVKSYSRQFQVAFHGCCARAALGFMFLLILMVEGRALVYGHVHVDLSTIIHWSFAIPCLTGLVMINWGFSGKRSSRHVLYAALTMLTLIGTDITGVHMANIRY